MALRKSPKAQFIEFGQTCAGWASGAMLQRPIQHFTEFTVVAAPRFAGTIPRDHPRPSTHGHRQAFLQEKQHIATNRPAF